MSSFNQIISDLRKEIALLNVFGYKTGRLICPRCGIEFGTSEDCKKHFAKTKHSGDYNTYERPRTKEEDKELNVLKAKLDQTLLCEKIVELNKFAMEVKNGSQKDNRNC